MGDVRETHVESREVTQPKSEHEFEEMTQGEGNADQAPVPVLIPFRSGIQAFLRRAISAGFFTDDPKLCEPLGGYVAELTGAELIEDFQHAIEEFNSSAPDGRKGNITVQEMNERQIQTMERLFADDSRGRALNAATGGKGARTFSEVTEGGRGYHGKAPRKEEPSFKRAPARTQSSFREPGM